MAQYATIADLGNLGLPAVSLSGVSADTQNAVLLAEGDRMDTYLRSQHTLPISSPFPRELVSCNAVMAGYAILQSHRGYDPSAVDDGFRLRYDDCIAWLKDLSAGRASLDQAVDATANINEGRPRVQTGGANVAYGTGTAGESRGW